MQVSCRFYRYPRTLIPMNLVLIIRVVSVLVFIHALHRYQRSWYPWHFPSRIFCTNVDGFAHRDFVPLKLVLVFCIYVPTNLVFILVIAARGLYQHSWYPFYGYLAEMRTNEAGTWWLRVVHNIIPTYLVLSFRFLIPTNLVSHGYYLSVDLYQYSWCHLSVK